VPGVFFFVLTFVFFGALVGYAYPHSATRIASGRALLVDRAKILVMRLRQIGRGAHQAEWAYGNGRSFSNGWFD